MTPTRSAGTARRWWLWVPLLGLAAWLAFFGDKSPTSNAAVSLPSRGTVSPIGVAAVVRSPAATDSKQEMLAPLVPRTELIPPAAASANGPSATQDPFSARNWNPPAPPPPTSIEPASPVAPPLPYAFIGKKQEADAWEVYLTRGEQTFVVRESQVLEGNYRVDKIAPPTLTVTYLPLGQVQTLPIGEAR